MNRVWRSLLRGSVATVMVAALFGAGPRVGGITGPLSASCASAASAHHAAVVVTHLSGRPSPVRVCVAFDEDHISGSDLLTRSGLQWQSDAYQGQGTAVCQVDNEPQAPPNGSCLGHNNDPYWSLWTASYGSGWTYAQRAITALVIRDGDAEGLRYQQPDGATPPDAPAGVCPPPSPAATQAPTSAPAPPAREPVSGPATAPATTAGTARPGTNPPGPSALGAGAAPGPSSPTADSSAAETASPATASNQGTGGGRPRAAPREVRATAPPGRLGLLAAGAAAIGLVGVLLLQLLLPRMRR